MGIYWKNLPALAFAMLVLLLWTLGGLGLLRRSFSGSGPEPRPLPRKAIDLAEAVAIAECVASGIASAAERVDRPERSFKVEVRRRDDVMINVELDGSGGVTATRFANKKKEPN
jgi:hypothetical protein